MKSTEFYHSSQPNEGVFKKIKVYLPKDEDQITPIAKLNVGKGVEDHEIAQNNHWGQIMGKPDYLDDSNYYTNTSVRKDVMNKTLFRSIRREYKQDFKDFCVRNNIKITRNSKYLEQAIQKYSNHLIDISGAAEAFQEHGSMSNLKYYVGLFVDFCKMRKLTKKSSDQETLKSFYDCLYSYSHKKFYDFVGIPEVKFLMKRKLEAEQVDKMISKYSTLKKNENHYRFSSEGLMCFLTNK